MYALVRLYELPIEYDGVRFQFADAGEESSKFEIDTMNSLALNTLVAGGTPIRTAEGFPCSALSHKSKVLVEIEAVPEGISLGGKVVALAHDLVGEDCDWPPFDCGPEELFTMMLAVSP